MTMSVVDGQPKNHANTSYKAAKHIERLLLVHDETRSPFGLRVNSP